MLKSCLGCEKKLPPKPATQLIADSTDFPMKNVRPARLLNSYKLKSYLSRGIRLNSFSGVLSWKNFVLFFCIYSLTFIRYSEKLPARFAGQHFPILLPSSPSSQSSPTTPPPPPPLLPLLTSSSSTLTCTLAPPKAL